MPKLMDNFELMESKRQHKYARQIQKDLSDIFQRNTAHFFGNNLVTIMGIEVAVDFSLARVYFSVFPFDATERVIENLNKHKGEIRWQLGNKIGKQVRIVPELAFFSDDTEEKASHMDQLIGRLNIPPASDEEE